jgi:tRNA uridine 5-carbamoylmethylation protein Kti12
MNINIPSIIIVAGKPGSGKSHFIKYWFYINRKNFDFGIVLTKTSFDDGYKFIPKDFIHPDYDEDKISALMKLQASLIKKGIYKKAFIILDDCLTKDFNNQVFQDLVTQSRHFNITLVISTQYIYKVNPTIRECANYAIIFRQSTKRSLEALYESFGQHFNKLDKFQQFVIDNTNDHQFVFVDINSSSDNINEIYKVMKVPDKIPKFTVKFNTKK